MRGGYRREKKGGPAGPAGEEEAGARRLVALTFFSIRVATSFIDIGTFAEATDAFVPAAIVAVTWTLSCTFGLRRSPSGPSPRLAPGDLPGADLRRRGRNRLHDAVEP